MYNSIFRTRFSNSNLGIECQSIPVNTYRGGGAQNSLVLKTKAYNYKLENYYKHTSLIGGII